MSRPKALLIAGQEEVDESRDVADGHGAAAVHVIIGGNVFAINQLVNQVGRVANGDIAVAIHITGASTDKGHNARELAPLFISALCVQSIAGHM